MPFGKDLSKSTDDLREVMEGVSNRLDRMDTQLEKLTMQMTLLQQSIDNLGTGFVGQMSVLNENLQMFGKNLTDSLVDNMRLKNIFGKKSPF